MSELDEAAAAVEDSSLAAYLHRLLTATRIEQAWALHLSRMAAFGFDRIQYSNACQAEGIGVLEDTLILSNHARDYLDRFLSSGMWRRGIFIRHAEVTGKLSVPWRVSDDMRLTPEDERALAYRVAHGLAAGYTISFRGYGRRGRAGTGLCARQGLDQDAVDMIWSRHGKAIEALCIAFHLRVSSLPVDLPGRALSPRQREVLRWASDGKTLQDIAVLMGVAVPTVEKHLRLARSALGVQTTTQAVLKASFLNQLYRVESPDPGLRSPQTSQ